VDDNRSTWIEFIGGPIDGYIDQFALPSRNLAIVRTAADHRRAGRLRSWLRRLLPWKLTNVTVLGVYRLTNRESNFRYHYMRSFSSTNVQFDDVYTELISRNADGSLSVPRQVELAAAMQRSEPLEDYWDNSNETM